MMKKKKEEDETFSKWLATIKESDNLKYLENQEFYKAIKQGLIDGKKDGPEPIAPTISETDCGIGKIYDGMSEEEILEEVVFELFHAEKNKDHSDRLSVYMAGAPEEDIATRLKEFFRLLQIKRCQNIVDSQREFFNSLENKVAATAAAKERREQEMKDYPKGGTATQRENIKASGNIEYLDNPVFYEAIEKGVIQGYMYTGKEPPEYMNEDVVIAILVAGDMGTDESKHLSKRMAGVPEEEKPEILTEFFKMIQIGLLEEETQADLGGGGLAFQKMRKRSRKRKSKRRKSKRKKRRKSKTRRRRR